MGELINGIPRVDTTRGPAWLRRAVGGLLATKAGGAIHRTLAAPIDGALMNLTKGRVSSGFGTVRLVVLRSTGAKTGAPRDVPLGYLTDGDDVILIASNYGQPRNPAWYRNLVANPKVEVLAGKRSGTYKATEITDPSERDRIWNLALDQYAGYADYEARASDRTIPLVRLERATG